MFILALALLAQTVHADDLANTGCTAGYSNASLSGLKIASGLHAIDAGDDAGTLTAKIMITNAKKPSLASGQNVIYFSATLPDSPENRKALDTFALHLEKGYLKELCLKPKDEWATRSQKIRLSYGDQPNTFIIDGKQPLPQN